MAFWQLNSLSFWDLILHPLNIIKVHKKFRHQKNYNLILVWWNFFIFREFFRSVKFQNWIPRVKLEATCGRGSNFFPNGPSRRKVPFGRDRVASQGTHHKCSERACHTCPGFADQTFESKLDLKTGKLSIYSLRTSSVRSKLKSKSFSQFLILEVAALVPVIFWSL